MIEWAVDSHGDEYRIVLTGVTWEEAYEPAMELKAQGLQPVFSFDELRVYRRAIRSE